MLRTKATSGPVAWSSGRPDRTGAPFQRHHVIPLQIFRSASLNAMMHAVRPLGFAAGDFGRNGMLLPSSEQGAMRDGRPMHRGPHPRYNEIVMERVGRIERAFSAQSSPLIRVNDAHFRLRLLQRALRRSLDGPGFLVPLNRRDPMSRNVDFTALDDMADLLWGATEAKF